MKLCALLLCVCCAAGTSVGTPLLGGSLPAGGNPDSLAKAIEADRERTQEWLRSSPTSYLAAIARVEFGDRTTLTIGSGASNDIPVPEKVFTPHHLSVTVLGDSFRVSSVDPGATFRTRAGEDLREAILPPSYIAVDRFSIRLSHQRFPAIIIFDPKSPRFAEYKGLSYFPVDPSFRFVLNMTVNDAPDTIVILSTRGNLRNGLREGWFRFSVKGVPCTLEVTRLLEPGIGEDMFSIFFRDRTSGKETYPVGRYLDVERLPDGRFVVDFNRAYNPACAVSPFYNCPLPPEDNMLPVRITAGEKDSHYQAHE